jgi:hypothetical protein
MRPYLKKTHHKNRAGGVTQGESPELKKKGVSSGFLFSTLSEFHKHKQTERSHLIFHNTGKRR